ncbi:hypothetical protein LCGC14_1819300 [marine sediment metagenome]|uniref:Uncharacterized protein n=1 Tax=marine sediment metagenome TaxID=412755 RepID=A0A0F9H7K0_9ZZZZ
MVEDKSLKEKIDILFDEKEKEEKKKYKDKRFRLPMKAKVGKDKMNKGFITVMTIKGNRNVDFVRTKIIGGTIKMEDKEPRSIHALNQDDIFLYKNKPFIIQPKVNLNPWNPLKAKNETYGQALVMARMEGDKITTKKGFGKAGWIIGAVILGIIAYAFITGA